MSAQPYLSEIALFSFGFAPRGWATCSGQLLPINQNQALFSLLGTTYGGNGQTTFALPDLRGRVSLGFGQGPGLGNYDLGQAAGSEAVTLDVTQLAPHAHALDGTGPAGTMKCKTGSADQRTPVGTVPATEATGVTATYSNAAPDATMNPAGVVLGGNVTAATTGSSQPHANVQPFLTLTFCIALSGVFPSQN